MRCAPEKEIALDRTGRLALAHDSLQGLSCGDALGAQFFVPGRVLAPGPDPGDLSDGRWPTAPWPWTDDTEMACTVVTELHDLPETDSAGTDSAGTGRAGIDQDRLALRFAQRCEPYRGYGPGSVVTLHAVRDGVPWRRAAAEAFGGRGSLGNGAAMRVAPLGAYFCGDIDRTVEQAVASAQVTHAHPEGIAGAVAVAAAACVAATARVGSLALAPATMLAAVAEVAPAGVVRNGIMRSIDLLDVAFPQAAYRLGNGSQATAQDSVPFSLWVAATHLEDYPTAIATCILAGGDVDTTAAMAGGIVAAHTGIGSRTVPDHTPDGAPDAADGGGRTVTGVPTGWLASREPLPDWMPPIAPS